MLIISWHPSRTARSLIGSSAWLGRHPGRSIRGAGTDPFGATLDPDPCRPGQAPGQGRAVLVQHRLRRSGPPWPGTEANPHGGFRLDEDELLLDQVAACQAECSGPGRSSRPPTSRTGPVVRGWSSPCAMRWPTWSRRSPAGAAISGCSARHWMARPASGPIQVIHGVRRGHVPLAREGASQGGAGSHGSGRGSSPPPSRPGPDP